MTRAKKASFCLCRDGPAYATPIHFLQCRSKMPLAVGEDLTDDRQSVRSLDVMPKQETTDSTEFVMGWFGIPVRWHCMHDQQGASLICDPGCEMDANLDRMQSRGIPTG